MQEILPMKQETEMQPLYDTNRSRQTASWLGQAALMAAMVITPAIALSQTDASRLQETIGFKTIGMNLAYVEKQLGPAMRSGYGSHEFDVDGCVFTLRTDDQNRSIKLVEIETSSKCPFTIGQFLSSDDRTPAHGLAFKKVEAMAGDWHYKATCLYLCGNGVPSTVYYWIPGSNSNGNIEVAFGRSLDDDGMQSAHRQMTDKLIAQFSEEFVQNGQFNCLPNQGNRTMAAAVSLSKIDRVVFGQAPIDQQLGVDCSEANRPVPASTATANEPVLEAEVDQDMRKYIIGVMDQIKTDPNAFVSECAKAETGIRMEYGGEDETTARRYAQQSCKGQLHDFVQCSQRGGEEAIACIHEAIGTEGDV